MTKHEAQALGHVALVVGGDSGEREVSLRGGRAIAKALESLGVQFSVVDGARRLLEQVAAGNFDRVFNILHGRGGEDGALQGALRLYGIPVTGSGVLASALAMDKIQTKRIWESAGLPTPPWRIARSADDAAQILDALAFPLFVKPSREGSSLGMARITNANDLAPAIEKALSFDPRVLVEQGVAGREYTGGVLGEQALPVIELRSPGDFYDFEAKYVSQETQYLCPCDLPATQERALAALCLQAFEVIGCHGWGRVDFMLDEHDQPWLLEVNTTPGMTERSCLPQAAAVAGMSYEELVWQILIRTNSD